LQRSVTRFKLEPKRLRKGGGGDYRHPITLLHPITKLGHALLSGARGATEDAAVRLDAMPDHPASAMSAYWRESLDGAFEAVKDVCHSLGSHLERLVIVVSANFTDRHCVPPSRSEEYGLRACGRDEERGL
jgi:hypothetical protein